jgi:hypothetical protein
VSGHIDGSLKVWNSETFQEISQVNVQVNTKDEPDVAVKKKKKIEKNFFFLGCQNFPKR